MDAVNISVVLDRSGSMVGIADDIVGGFNQFLARQRQEDGEARISVAQFDDGDPFEVLLDSVPVREVTDLARSAYQPRGATPLYDAIAWMIARVDARAADRDSAGLDEEDQLVVVVTDGLENASRKHTRRSVFDMITERRQKGWSFLFLGADQDSFASGQAVAVASSNIANWEKSVDGTAKMWRDVSHSTSEYLKRSATSAAAATTTCSRRIRARAEVSVGRAGRGWDGIGGAGRGAGGGQLREPDRVTPARRSGRST